MKDANCAGNIIIYNRRPATKRRERGSLVLQGLPVIRALMVLILRRCCCCCDASHSGTSRQQTNRLMREYRNSIIIGFGSRRSVTGDVCKP